MMRIKTVLQSIALGAMISLLGACALPTGTASSSGASLANSGANSGGRAAYGSGGAIASGAGSAGQFNGQGNIYANGTLLKKYHTVYFAYDSNMIKPWGLKPLNANLAHAVNPHPTSDQVLNAYANYLIKHPNSHIRLEGNTDKRGSREYNIALGERRADSVARQLEAAGVRAKQITVISYGKEKPVALGSDEAAYSLNRRVNVIIEA